MYQCVLKRSIRISAGGTAISISPSEKSFVHIEMMSARTQSASIAEELTSAFLSFLERPNQPVTAKPPRVRITPKMFPISPRNEPSSTLRNIARLKNHPPEPLAKKAKMMLAAATAKQSIEPTFLILFLLYIFDIKSAPAFAGALVPIVGVEPTRCCHQRILSPSRLPIPSYRRNTCLFYHKTELLSIPLLLQRG